MLPSDYVHVLISTLSLSMAIAGIVRLLTGALSPTLENH